MRPLGCSFIGLLALCSIARLAQPQPSVLTRDDALAAVDLGQHGDPRPYLLHHASAIEGDVTPVVVGAVFTPFLRVALAARRARERNAPVKVEDLQVQWGSPVVYVALRWYCCDSPDPAAFDPFGHFDFTFGLRQREERTLGLRPPLEVFRGTDVLDEFGGTLPYNDVVLVAVYPLASLHAGTEFVISRRVNGATFTRIGRVTAENYVAWR
jgi:hypothetical protein